MINEISSVEHRHELDPKLDGWSSSLMNQSILWRGVYTRGHEACRLYHVSNEWHLQGTAVFISDDLTCHLSYVITCDSSWNTLNGIISGWLGNKNINVELSVDASHQWRMNGVKQSAVSGCVDVDLNFSPAT